MRKSSWLYTLVACLALASSLHAEFILWVCDNGTKGTIVGSDGVTRGAFYPAAASNGTPFVDQGFVDLLIAAGHSVTRFNPNSTSMSIDDVPPINSYDVIILGAALNSGPFNLNSRGARWTSRPSPSIGLEQEKEMSQTKGINHREVALTAKVEKWLSRPKQ